MLTRCIKIGVLFAWGVLVYQQPARGPTGLEGLACTYDVEGTERTIFHLSYCPFRHEFDE